VGADEALRRYGRGLRLTASVPRQEIPISQNRVALAITDEPLAARRCLPLMGPRSEPFARQTLRVLEQNPGIVPPSLDLAAARLVT
jgi:hypothetical protein